MGSTRVPGVPYILDWQEPTYIGFEIQFDFSGTDSAVRANVDSLVDPLLMGPENETSAIRYLQNINELTRSKSLAVFRHILKTVSEKAPWHFQSISGLDKLFVINPEKNWRTGDDTEITIDCLEGLDMKMTALVDLYRKSVWDPLYHRWMLPDNMRYFNCTITLTDYREFHRTSALVTSLGSTATDVQMNEGYQESIHDLVYGKNTDAFSKAEIEKSVKKSVKDAAANMMNQVLSEGEVTADDTFKPRVVLYCTNCEFTMLSKSHPYVSTISNAEPPEMAKQQISFKVGRVYEAAAYDLIGVVLDDKLLRTTLGAGAYDYTNAAATSSMLELLEYKIKKKSETLLSGRFLGNAYNFSPSDLENTAANLAKAVTKELLYKNKIEKSASFESPKSKTDIDKTIELGNERHDYGPPLPAATRPKHNSKSISTNKVDFIFFGPPEAGGQSVNNFTNKHNLDNEVLKGQKMELTNDAHKPTMGENIDLEEPKIIKTSLGNIEFSGPPSI